MITGAFKRTYAWVLVDQLDNLHIISTPRRHHGAHIGVDLVQGCDISKSYRQTDRDRQTGRQTRTIRQTRLFDTQVRAKYCQILYY